MVAECMLSQCGMPAVGECASRNPLAQRTRSVTRSVTTPSACSLRTKVIAFW